MEHKFSTRFILFYFYIKMPQGKGTYGTKRGRPPMKAKEMKDKRSRLKKTKAKPLVKKPMKKKCNGNCK
jgi:hypothetical protein